ncbi:hypothetical protein [Xenorhabdus budapestensis]|uniref:Uncharacterized protein n=1 Tax=Xenorhabdus budapestensis TaxID=290110 RepID=A0A2D0J3N8_XENBU|nr:hypothetical protein [Xenorhabdus budapestensis]PHM29105.1 hypothetical protein Xbud_00546 [Xenorhabdus budapestensis]
MIEYAIKGTNNLFDPKDRYELEDPEWDENYPYFLAEECAEHYLDYCDGQEDSWPIEITVFNNGESLGTFSVELDYSPDFRATRKNNEQ